jgi:hypothetical protein
MRKVAAWLFLIAVTGLFLPNRVMGIADVPRRWDVPKVEVTKFGVIDRLIIAIDVAHMSYEKESDFSCAEQGEIICGYDDTLVGTREIRSSWGGILPNRKLFEANHFFSAIFIVDSKLFKLTFDKGNVFRACFLLILRRPEWEKSNVCHYFNSGSLSYILKLHSGFDLLVGGGFFNKCWMGVVNHEIRSLFNNERLFSGFHGFFCGFGSRSSGFSRDSHLFQLLTCIPGVNGNDSKSDESNDGAEGSDENQTPITPRISKKWRFWACASGFSFFFLFGLVSLWLVYSAVRVKRISIFNIAKMGFAVLFLLAGFVAIHAALDLLYFGQVYMEHLL